MEAIFREGGIEMAGNIYQCAMVVDEVELPGRCNVLRPGAILTDRNRARLADPAFEASVVERIPSGRIGVPLDSNVELRTKRSMSFQRSLPRAHRTSPSSRNLRSTPHFRSSSPRNPLILD